MSMNPKIFGRRYWSRKWRCEKTLDETAKMCKALGMMMNLELDNRTLPPSRCDGPRNPYQDVCYQLKLDKHHGPLPWEGRESGAVPHTPMVIGKCGAHAEGMGPQADALPFVSQMDIANAIAASLDGICITN